MNECVALVPAAGMGRRMGSRKAFIPYKGRPLLELTLAALAKVSEITRVVVALHAEDMELWEREPLWPSGDPRMCRAVVGGETRAHSVEAAFKAVVQELGHLDFLALVHDAARPFTDRKLISSLVHMASEGCAASCAVDVVDTIKEVGANGNLRTLERGRLKSMQTPQVIHARDFHRGFEHWRSCGSPVVTDDLQIMEPLGLRVLLLPGDPSNIKITFPADLTAGK